MAQVTDLRDLVVTYARQETVDPLKTLGRHLGWGMAGSVLVASGWAFGLLALLRGLQQLAVFNDPTEVTGGHWSWAPYAIVAFVGIVVAAVHGLLVRRRLQDPPGRLPDDGRPLAGTDQGRHR